MNKSDYQERVNEWMQLCFGEIISADTVERNHRFLEEALELVQSLGCTSDEAHQLVDYVFNRPIGEPFQECGGVMVTLAALATAAKLSMVECSELELKRIWGKVEQIRKKQASKPKYSPLPTIEPAPDPLLRAFQEDGIVIKSATVNREKQQAEFVVEVKEIDWLDMQYKVYQAILGKTATKGAVEVCNLFKSLLSKQS